MMNNCRSLLHKSYFLAWPTTEGTAPKDGKFQDSGARRRRGLLLADVRVAPGGISSPGLVSSSVVWAGDPASEDMLHIIIDELHNYTHGNGRFQGDLSTSSQKHIYPGGMPRSKST